MHRMLSDLGYRDLRLAPSITALHHASTAILFRKAIEGWMIGRFGIRGALIAVPFGVQRITFQEDLPGYLDPTPWKPAIRGYLRPEVDLTARVEVWLLPGVGPGALTTWQAMAPSCPTTWVDLAFPTTQDADHIREALGGILHEDGADEDHYPDDPFGLDDRPPVDGFHPVPGLRNGTGGFALSP